MAPLPKRRHSRARKGKRRQAISLKSTAFGSCPNCGALKRPHMVCQNCGNYKGKPVIVKKEKKTRKEKKGQ
ncbi:MAG: 50S ribosomal protein L32 [bacterium]|nr:50S ribosomal protein L32 [bacterium]